VAACPARYDLSKLRVMGILQRVACCYLTAALFEIWVPVVDTPVSASDRGDARYSKWRVFSKVRDPPPPSTH
jgi:hypothetical protein